MCFVVGALRRAMLIHARVVLSADDFYGRKSDQSLFPSIFFFFLYIPLFRCYFICSLWKKEEILVSIGGQRNMYHLSSNSCFSRVFVFSVSINLLLSCSLHVHLSLSLSLSFSLLLSTSCLGTRSVVHHAFVVQQREDHTQCNRVTSNSR